MEATGSDNQENNAASDGRGAAGGETDLEPDSDHQPEPDSDDPFLVAAAREAAAAAAAAAAEPLQSAATGEGRQGRLRLQQRQRPRQQQQQEAKMLWEELTAPQTMHELSVAVGAAKFPATSQSQQQQQQQPRLLPLTYHGGRATFERQQQQQQNSQVMVQLPPAEPSKPDDSSSSQPWTLQGRPGAASLSPAPATAAGLTLAPAPLASLAGPAGRGNAVSRALKRFLSDPMEENDEEDKGAHNDERAWQHHKYGAAAFHPQLPMLFPLTLRLLIQLLLPILQHLK